MTTRAALIVAPSSPTTRLTNAPTRSSSRTGVAVGREVVEVMGEANRGGAALASGAPLVLRREPLGELVARVDAELPVGVAEVVLDGLRAEEELGRRLARREAAREHEPDLELLRG